MLCKKVPVKTFSGINIQLFRERPALKICGKACRIMKLVNKCYCVYNSVGCEYIARVNYGEKRKGSSIIQVLHNIT